MTTKTTTAECDETYRGVKVPPSTERNSEWFRGVDAAMGFLRPMVEALHWDTPCELNPSNHCLEHLYFGEGPCPDSEAREVLKVTRTRG